MTVEINGEAGALALNFSVDGSKADWRFSVGGVI